MSTEDQQRIDCKTEVAAIEEEIKAAREKVEAADDRLLEVPTSAV
jgi:hypothetical protein